MRNMLAHLPERDMSSLANAVRIVFDRPDRFTAYVQLHVMVQKLRSHYLESRIC